MQRLKESASCTEVEARGVEVEEGRPDDREALAPGLDHLAVRLRPRAEHPPACAGADNRREGGVSDRGGPTGYARATAYPVGHALYYLGLDYIF